MITREYNHVAPFYDAMADTLKAAAGVWVTWEVKDLPGTTLRNKQSRIHRNMESRGLVVSTRALGETLFACVRKEEGAK